MGQSPPEQWREAIRRTVVDLFPELGRGLHLPIRAKVVSVAAVTAGVSTRRGYGYSCTVRPLKRDGSEAGPDIPDVPIPKIWGGAGGRGIFALPAVGSTVAVVFDYGDPALPRITDILPEGEELPAAALDELVIQQDSTTLIRMRADRFIEIVSGVGVLIGQGDNAQALGDGLKTCLVKLIDELIPLCTSATTMGAVLGAGVAVNLNLLKTAIQANAGDGEIVSIIHKTSKL